MAKSKYYQTGFNSDALVLLDDKDFIEQARENNDIGHHRNALFLLIDREDRTYKVIDLNSLNHNIDYVEERYHEQILPTNLNEIKSWQN